MREPPTIRPWPQRIVRNLMIWTAVCSISAAPSFFIGGMLAQGDPQCLAAMVTGVLIFIAVYTLAASTDIAEQLRQKPIVRRTITIGYGIRIAQSLLSLVPPVMIVDMYLGMVSVLVVGNTIADSEHFAGFLLITLLQGTLLNLVMAPLLMLVYAAQRALPRQPAAFDPTKFCAQCGYDLRASTGTCPECGHPIPAATETQATAASSTPETARTADESDEKPTEA